MPKYFRKKQTFFAYHGEPEVFPYSPEARYRLEERVHFNAEYPSVSNYSTSVCGLVYAGLVPCTREEFETAKAAALAAIAALMDTEQLQAA